MSKGMVDSLRERLVKGLAFGKLKTSLVALGGAALCVSAAHATAPTIYSESYFSGTFNFTALGAANSTWTVYTSVDLYNWKSAGTVTLNAYGYSTYSDSSLSGVPYKFYRLSNSTDTSQAAGFQQFTAGPADFSTGSGAVCFADQLIGSNSLSSLFWATPNLPDGTEVEKFDSSGNNPTTYTYSGGSWSGNTTVNPGEAAFLMLPSTSSQITITFVGVVPAGVNSATIHLGDNFMSSFIPVNGVITNVFNWPNDYNPTVGSGPLDGDVIAFWNGSSYDITCFDSNPADFPAGYIPGFTDQDGNPVAAPSVSVSQGFVFQNNNQSFVSSQTTPAGVIVP